MKDGLVSAASQRLGRRNMLAYRDDFDRKLFLLDHFNPHVEAGSYQSG